MLNKISEIFASWRIQYDPNKEQSELAAERIKICDGCENKQEVPVIHCGLCGCLLKSKIYSPNIGACPQDKWRDAEEKYYKQNNNE